MNTITYKMKCLVNSPLQYLKDYDIIQMLLEYVENTDKYSRIFHMKR